MQMETRRSLEGDDGAADDLALGEELIGATGVLEREAARDATLEVDAALARNLEQRGHVAARGAIRAHEGDAPADDVVMGTPALWRTSEMPMKHAVPPSRTAMTACSKVCLSPITSKQ